MPIPFIIAGISALGGAAASAGAAVATTAAAVGAAAATTATAVGAFASANAGAIAATSAAIGVAAGYGAGKHNGLEEGYNNGYNKASAEFDKKYRELAAYYERELENYQAGNLEHYQFEFELIEIVHQCDIIIKKLESEPLSPEIQECLYHYYNLRNKVRAMAS